MPQLVAFFPINLSDSLILTPPLHLIPLSFLFDLSTNPSPVSDITRCLFATEEIAYQTYIDIFQKHHYSLYMSTIIRIQKLLLLSAFVLHSAATDDEKERAALHLMKNHCCVHSYIQKMVVKNAANKEMFTFDMSDDIHVQATLKRKNLTFNDMQNIIQKMSAQQGLQTWWNHLTKEKKEQEERRHQAHRARAEARRYLAHRARAEARRYLAEELARLRREDEEIFRSIRQTRGTFRRLWEETEARPSPPEEQPILVLDPMTGQWI